MSRRACLFLAFVAGLAASPPRAPAQPYPAPSTWVPAGTIVPVPVAPPPDAGMPQPPPVPAFAPPANPDGTLVPPGQPCPAAPPAPGCPVPTYPVYPSPIPTYPPPYPLVPAVAYPTARPLASATDGVYLDFELFIAKPTLKIQPSDPDVTFSQLPPLSLPRVQPGTYVSPLFEVGYRFSEGTPYLAANYRFVGTDGQGTGTSVAGLSYDVSTQFRVHQFGFDVGGGTAPPPTDLALAASRWSFGWRLGVQVVNFHYETQVQREFHTSSIENDYWAAGPHGRLGLEYRLGCAPELSLFSQLDGSLLIGEGTRTSQVQFVRDDGTSQQRTLRYSMTKPAPVLMLILGLSYRPEAAPDLRLSAGYVYEHWWSMGLVTRDEGGVDIGTKGEVTSHGLFLQARYDF